MMQIQCCSKDKALFKKMVALYGSGSVVGMDDDYRQIADNIQDKEVLVVDLKYNDLPNAIKATSAVIVLTTVPNFKEALMALQAGVRGYGNRQMRSENLKQAIENVYAGQIWLPPSIVFKLIDVVGHKETSDMSESKNKMLSLMSKREKEVALLVAKGMSNQEVADKMYVSLRTVKAHLSAIYEKTSVRNRLELGLALA